MKKTTKGGLLAYLVVMLYIIALFLMVGTCKAETKFQKAYKYVVSHEGNYSNHPNDLGGETYRGIARKFNRNWYGWRHIDKVKNKKWNQEIPEANFWAQDYYLTIWVREGYENIKDTTLAVYIFDIRVNGVHSIKEIKRAINDYNALPINMVMDEKTIDMINTLNSRRFLRHLEKRRIAFYNRVVKKDSSQLVFLSGWKKRAKLKQQ